MTKYVEGISTPPLSPKEAEPVNQMRISDASSPDNLQWIQNGNDCKYLFMTVYDICHFCLFFFWVGVYYEYVSSQFGKFKHL